MSRATLDAIRQTTHLGERERLAWLLKTVLAPEHASEAISRILDRAEADEVRLWIVEAVERLIFGGSIGWDQLGGVIAMLAQSPSPALRAKLASVLTALPWRATNVQWLEPLLRDADPEVVSSAAHTLARHPDATRQLRPLTLEQLRANPNSLIRHAAASLDAALGQQSSDRGTG
jgi:hypothetical protein